MKFKFSKLTIIHILLVCAMIILFLVAFAEHWLVLLCALFIMLIWFLGIHFLSKIKSLSRKEFIILAEIYSFMILVISFLLIWIVSK